MSFNLMTVIDQTPHFMDVKIEKDSEPMTTLCVPAGCQTPCQRFPRMFPFSVHRLTKRVKLAEMS